jgi:cytochrome oxidase Cu insertion factor (SCO1/SenC/PrrC family)
VFVTVDPKRDTVQSMHAYLSSFDKHIRGYTGTPAEIAQIAKEYRVYYQNRGSGYSMTSSASTSKLCGTVRPSALAVLRLITSSNLVGS